MVTKTQLINRVMRIKDKSEVFHSSGYARAQSGQNFGAAGSDDFHSRQSVDNARKFVRSYNNARIINDAHAFDRVRSYIPRTGTTESASNPQPNSRAALARKPQPIQTNSGVLKSR